MGLWQDARSRHAKGSNKSTPLIPNLERKNTNATKVGTIKIQKQNEPGAKPTMTKTETTASTSTELVPQKVGKSKPLLEVSDLVKLPSMNLIDESAQHIHDLMRGLHANMPPADIKAFDHDKVMVAVACADEIHKLMRLKLDVIRTAIKINEK